MKIPWWVSAVMDIRGQQLRVTVQSWMIAMMIVGTALSTGRVSALLLAAVWATIAFFDTWLYRKTRKHITSSQVGYTEDPDGGK